MARAMCTRTLRKRGRSAGSLARALSISALLAIILVLLVFSVSAWAGASYSPEELAIFSLINEYRKANGLSVLLLSDTISDACTKHNLDMGKYGFPPNPIPDGVTGHTTQASDYFPVGSAPWDRMRISGYDYPLAVMGEVIGYGYTWAPSLLEAWQNSFAHNSVLLDSRYRVAGVSMDEVPGSPWTYYWTIDFGEFIDLSAHEPGDPSPTTTTAPTPTTTTVPPSTTTTVPPSTTTTTTMPPTTTTTTGPPPTTATTVPPPTTTTTTVPAPQFIDVSASYRFYHEISALAAASIVSGYADNSFRPDHPLTRAQFAKIIVLAVSRHTEQVEGIENPVFRDVVYTGQSYPFDFVQEAADLNIIKGTADGTFGPYRNLTRAQLALMLVRAGGAALTAPPADFTLPFTDVPAYAKEAVAVGFHNGLLSGKTGTTFEPYGVATRGQMAKMVCRLVERLRS